MVDTVRTLGLDYLDHNKLASAQAIRRRISYHRTIATGINTANVFGGYISQICTGLGRSIRRHADGEVRPHSTSLFGTLGEYFHLGHGGPRGWLERSVRGEFHHGVGTPTIARPSCNHSTHSTVVTPKAFPLKFTTICAHGTELLPFAAWKNAKVTPLNLSNWKVMKKCKDSEYVQAFDIPFNQDPVFVMRNCHHNDIVALHNRYLKDTPKVSCNLKIVKQLTDEFIGLILPHFSGKISASEFLSEKKGALGVRYSEATKNLIEQGFDLNKHNDIKMFIKNEKYSELKPPRAIMGRNPMFNIAYGQYTVPIEHAMMQLPQFTKGRNFLERGECFENLTGEWYLENDYSKYESSQRLIILDTIEKRIFRALYPGDAFIMDLYESKLMKKGMTSNGVKFKFIGCRGSGDMDTGLFNSILNWIACRYFEIHNNFPWSGKFIVDGDDGVIKSPRGVECFLNTFEHFGFEAKLELRKDYHDVNFCSSKFVQTTPGVYYQVQDLNKLLSQCKFMINSAFLESLVDYYSSLGFMYSVLYPNFPVYSAFSQYLQSCGFEYFKRDMVEKVHYGASQAFTASKDLKLQIDPQLLRAEIALCFNIPHQEQRKMENWFLSNKLDFPPEYSKPYSPKIRKLKLEYSEDVINRMFDGYVRPCKISRDYDKL